MRIAYADRDDLYASILAYQYAFSQPHPKYAQKMANGWRTIPHTLGYKQALDHVSGNRVIGTLGRWYPEFGVLDFDDASIRYIESVRENIGLDESNSVLFTSESPDSYHLYFRPVVGDKKPTLRYYQKSMQYVAENYCEVYPQANRVIRLPFGRGQHYVKNGIPRSIDYVDGMAMLKTIDEYQLQGRGYHEAWDEIDTMRALPSLDKLQAGWKREGLAYINEGLTDANQRLEATKRVIYFYWSQNVTPEMCITETKKWIKNHHNGYSEDWRRDYRAVYRQIEQLTAWIYDKFAKQYILPDIPQMLDHGYHTRESVRAVVEASAGKMPLIKFAMPLVSYCQARGGNHVNVHRDRLANWGSASNYVRYIERLEQASLLHRNHHYSVGNFAKKITLELPPMREADKISLADDAERAEHDVKTLIRATYDPAEYYHTQKRNKCTRDVIYRQIDEIWGEAKPMEVQLAKMSTMARIAEYRMEHPDSTQKEASQKLQIPLRTIERYWAKCGGYPAKSSKK